MELNSCNTLIIYYTIISVYMKKLFHIKTYGCQMNYYDSNKISDLLSQIGYEQSNSFEKCDLAILNTCHIREKASEKMYSDVGRLSILKQNKIKTGRDFKIVVAGCVAQAEGKQIFKRNKNVDIIIGPQTYHRLPELLSKTQKAIANDFPDESKFDYLPKTRKTTTSAFVTIQEGCDKFCSFCVVPYTRGAEFSRSVNEIYYEIEHLVNLGVKEISLLGQNVSSFHGNYRTKHKNEKYSLAQLIQHISRIDGLQRIRYITSHPSDITNELIHEHGVNQKLMPYLHLPIQSGSNRILKKMNRRHSKESYIELIKKLREVRSDLAISSDFIVGYPGEKSKDFEDTLEVIRKINFASSYSFKYSERPGTPASLIKNSVTDEIKNQRLKILQKELDEQQVKFNKSFIGHKLSVLFEKKGKKPNQFVGRSQYLQPVHVISKKTVIGQIHDVAIQKRTSYSLHGNLIK